MNLIDVKSATITEKGQVSLQICIRRQKFKVGTKVAIIAYDDRIEIRPFQELKHQLETAYASEKTLAKDWNAKGEDKKWKNL
jgi:hypothetical protein